MAIYISLFGIQNLDKKTNLLYLYILNNSSYASCFNKNKNYLKCLKKKTRKQMYF